MKIELVLFLQILIFTNLFSQKKDDVLVKVGDRIITTDEFKYRYEFTPQISRKERDKGKAKEELLYTLIAEKLFAQEAEKLGYDTVLAMRMNYQPMEKMHVRDELYKKEIKDSVTIDNNKVTEGLWLANHKLFLDYVYSKNKDSIYFAYQELEKSNKFDSTVALLKNVEYVSDPYEVSYGKLFPETEKAVFELDVNKFTTPQQSPDGWYIFRLLSRIPVEYKTVDQKLSLVNKTVENRNEDSVFNVFWGKFFTDKKVTTDGSIFWYFAESMQKLIESIKTKNTVKDGEKITITSDEFLRYKNSLSPDSLAKPFIKFDVNPISLNDFLTEFMFEGFYSFTTDFNTIANQLNSRVKRQIELELLSRKGYELGLESMDDVIKSTKIWKENYLSTLYKKDIVLGTKLADSEVNDFLKQKGDSLFGETQVKIIEVFTDSLEVVKQALAIANNDEELKTFASIHTKRNEAKLSNGEMGFFPISEFGEIGKMASTMEIGDVYGPLDIDGSYSVFKLIDKRNLTVDQKSTEGLNEIKQKVLYNKIVNKLENNAVELAEKYGISINENLLNSLQLNNLQMLVYRYMGFGGRILAFPYSSPFYEWKEKWEQKKKDLL